MQLFQWFGAFLTQIAENCGGIGPAVCVFTLIAAVFLFLSTMGEIRSLQLADKIRDLHNGIIQKYGSDSGKMARDGFAFFLSVNQVWLTPIVPAEYLEKMP